MNALTTKAAGTSLAPQNLTEAMRFADMLANSTMVPKDFQGKPANVLVAIQWGYEVGLGPLQAVQNIAVINGRPAIWGDAALALVRGHPACEYVQETTVGDGEQRAGMCEIKRRGQPVQTRQFSVADAKRAGLWGKAGPWTQYPDRMLQLRARGFAIRDVFPDALRGVITAEEAQDTPTEPLPPARGPVVEAEPPAALPTTLTAPWAGMEWPVCDRSGKCTDLGDPDAWAAELQRRVAAIQNLSTLDDAAKRKAIGQVREANRGAMFDLAARGYQGEVADMEALFRKALGEEEADQ